MPAYNIGLAFRMKVISQLCEASTTRYRLVLYGPSAMTPDDIKYYTPVGEIQSTSCYTNTGVAATSGIPLTSRMSLALEFTFDDVILTSATGETLGPIHTALIIDTTDNTVFYRANYNDLPRHISNGGKATLDFPSVIMGVW